MNALEKQFSQTVKEHKSTIYTVCYMFSKDEDKVNDLFQEVLVNLWKGFESFEHRSDIKIHTKTLGQYQDIIDQINDLTVEN